MNLTPRFTGQGIKLRRFKDQLRRTVVGDRYGGILLVGASLLFALFWQVGFLLNDTWTIANTLVGVADGHLYIDRVVYGTYNGAIGDSPGTHVVGRRVYGRNYGQVFLALPFLWVLEIATVVVDPRVLFAGTWSLGLVLFAHLVGKTTGRYQSAVTVGSGMALVMFAGNVWLGTTLPLFWLHQLALQLSTILAAALLVVTLYRLLGTVIERRLALFLAGFASVATPIVFWSTAPKRHTLTALLVILTVFSFALSRRTESDTSALRLRALAYVWVGLLAWVHAAEALVTLLALVSVDMLTARSITRRDLATIAVVFLVSMLPFFLTNAAVTGNPLYPPRLWSNFHGTEQVLLNTDLGGQATPTPEVGTPGQSTGGGQPRPGGGSVSFVETTLAIISSASITLIDVSGQLWGQVSRSLSLVAFEPNRIFRTFFRSGWGPEQARDVGPVNITILESAPILGAAVALPAFARRHAVSSPRSWSPQRQTDLLVAVTAVLFVLIYLPRIPIRVAGTVRYLHPIYPLAVYAVARLPPVRIVLREHLRIVGWSLAGGVLIGSQLMIVGLTMVPSTSGDAIQFHAVVNLVLAGFLSAWTIGYRFDVRAREHYWTVGAVLIGLALAAGTVTMAFMTWNHLGYGDPVLATGRIFRFVIPP